MANPGSNNIKFGRKYIANNAGDLAGPPTYIVDTSQTRPVTTKKEESNG